MKALVIVTIGFYLYHQFNKWHEARQQAANKKRFKKLYRISI